MRELAPATFAKNETISMAIYFLIIMHYFLFIVPVSFSNPKYLDKTIRCYLQAMDEYTLDNRGDIGAWVREAAMNGTKQIYIKK